MLPSNIRPTRHPVGVAMVAILLGWSCGSDTVASPPPPPTGPTNTAPVANAGADQTVSATLPVTLQGTATDADGDPVTYAWTLVTVPSGSQASLSNATTASPTFTPDLPGTYTAQLIVNDGTDPSAPDQVDVVAQNNSATALVGTAGGTVTSVDGSVTLAIPAGAVGADTNITMTLVPDVQRPAELASLSPNAVVYDLQPNGLQFTTPARITITLPAVAAGSAVTPVVAVSLSNGVLDLAPNQQLDATDAGARTASADVGHFSLYSWDVLLINNGASAGKQLDLQASGPVASDVGVPFDVTVRILSDAVDLVPAATVAGVQTDQSVAPVGANGSFDPTFTQDPTFAFLSKESTNSYVCSAGGTGTWGARVDLSILDTDIVFAGLTTTSVVQTFVVNLSRDVVCNVPPQPFQSYTATAPEGISSVGNIPRDGWFVARSNGMTATTDDGQRVAEFDFATPGANAFGAVGMANDGALVITDAGIYEWVGLLPTTPSATPPMITLLPLAAPPGGPDVTAHTTDIVPLGGDFASGKFAATLFGNQDIAFITAGSAAGAAPGGPQARVPGFVVDTSFSKTFVDQGVSVFGTDRPVSVYVGSNGFTPTDPMLAATVAGDGSGTSQLLLLTLVNGKAVATPVTNVFPAGEVRRLRCLQGICAISAFGTAFGFGGMSFFQWDGQSTITSISGRAGRTIGIDLIDSGNGSVLIASTDFNGNMYTVDEISLAGQFVTSNVFPVPAGCTGPGHIVFRDVTEVIISCNTSGNIVSDKAFAP